MKLRGTQQFFVGESLYLKLLQQFSSHPNKLATHDP